MFENELESFKAKYPLIKEYLPQLEKTLSEEKFLHSIGCMITSYELMISQLGKSSCSFSPFEKETLLEKSVIAGLLHDCAKNLSIDEMVAICEKFGITEKEVGSMSRSLLHAPVGVFIAQRDYKIKDVEILNAIRYHTTGRANMLLLEKVVYMADVVEPTREITYDVNPGDRENIIRQAKSDLNLSLLAELEKGIRIIIKSGKFLNLDTVNARNFLLNK